MMTLAMEVLVIRNDTILLMRWYSNYLIWLKGRVSMAANGQSAPRRQLLFGGRIKWDGMA